MDDTSSRTYIIHGLVISLKLLRDISGGLPPPTSAVVALVQDIVAAVDEVKSNRDSCDRLRDRLLRILPVIIALIKKSASGRKDEGAIPPELKRNIAQFQNNLVSILEEVKKIRSVITSKRKRHKVAAFFMASSHASALQKCNDDLEWAMSEFDVTSRLTDAVRICNISRNLQAVLTNQLLESVPRAKYAGFDSERPDRPSTCIEGTRTDLLKMIMDWVTDADHAGPRFFWLKGIAGVGKTTVARTVAELVGRDGLLGGQFAFSRRDEADLRNPALVFPTIAYQLARFDPEFCQRITAALEADPEAPYASLKQQLERLIINPLSGLQRDRKQVVAIIFDAFDECEARGAREILQLLVAAMPSLPFWLKILITSRPEPHISSVLDPSSAPRPLSNLRIAALHDIEASIVKTDILLYLRARLRGLPAERDIDLPPDWIKDHEIQLLADKAGTLFIHAATSLRFLLEALDLRNQLDLLLKIIGSDPVDAEARAENPFLYLDQLYLEILRGTIAPSNELEVLRTLQPVVGSIVLLRDPLPVDALERLIGLKRGKASGILPLLHSVILPPSPPDQCPRIYHPSFPDFLRDEARCLDPRFWIDAKVHETRMARQCLELLNTKLHKGMLGGLDPTLLNSEVEDLEGKIQATFSPELQYACQHWASHLLAADGGDPALMELLEVFAAKTLLPWMESMSWLGKLRLCLTTLERVNAWVVPNVLRNSDTTLTGTPFARKVTCPSPTKDLINDGYRFLLAHFTTVTLAAQHLSRSVFPFIPRNTRLASQYKDYADKAVTVLGGTDPDWSACLLVLRADCQGVNSLALSGDGSRLAATSNDGLIRIWDPISGSCIMTLQGHSDWVRSVSLSPDGIQLASGSSDNTVRLWDTTTGMCLATLNSHISSVQAVAFSPNGSLLASASSDSTIRIWDANGRTCLQVLRSNHPLIGSLSFSLDGSQLASVSSDWAVLIWDVLEGKHVASLTGHSDHLSSVRFSPDGQHLLSSGLDSTARIWDVITHACVATLNHPDSVRSAAYSPDGLRAATGCDDMTVRVWDATSHSCLATLSGHGNVINAVIVFSPDGLRLASGSEDDTIRIWDTVGGHTGTPLERHSKCVNCLAFSPDGTRFASGSHDDTVRIWDTNTVTCRTILRGHSYGVKSVNYFASGLHVTSTDFAGKTCVWDTLTGFQVESPTDIPKAPNGPARHQLELDKGRVYRSDSSGTKRLICILPVSYTIWAIDFFFLDAETAHVVFGTHDGSIILLKVVLS